MGWKKAATLGTAGLGTTMVEALGIHSALSRIVLSFVLLLLFHFLFLILFHRLLPWLFSRM